MFNTNQVAKKLGIHPEHLRRLIREGKVKAERAPGKRKYYITDQEFLRIEKMHGKPKGKENQMIERLQENAEAALYELELLKKRVNPPKNSSIELQFNLIASWLKDE